MNGREGYALLAESVVVDPDHPEQLNTVLREVLSYWCKQHPQRYIEKIYADAATEHGDMLARKLYFSPLYHVSDTAYVLDLRRPGISKVVRNFQECLKQKENQIRDKKVVTNPPKSGRQQVSRSENDARSAV